MNSDLLAVLDYMEREKGIKREILLEALSGALLTAAKKSVGPARDLRVTIDPKSGEITALANLIVADVVRSIHDEIPLARARKIKPDAVAGEYDELRGLMAPDSMIPPDAQATEIALRGEMMNVAADKRPAPATVFDFGFATRAAAELAKEEWKPEP